MSSIAFITKTKEARVRGPERHMFGIRIDDFAWTALGLKDGMGDGYITAFVGWCWPDVTPEDRKWLSKAEHVAMRLRHGMFGDKNPEPFNWWLSSLATAVAGGSDLYRLAANIHGGCEIHTWVAERDREWLASIIEKGRAVKFLRDEMGWEAVIKLLRDETAPGNLYTSYSVTDSFPRPDYCGFVYDEEADNDPWQQMSDIGPDEAWARNEKHMAEVAHPSLRMSPDTWGDHTAYGETAWEIREKFFNWKESAESFLKFNTRGPDFKKIARQLGKYELADVQRVGS